MQLISAHIFHVYIVVSNPSRDIGHILDFVTRLKKLRVSPIRVAILTNAEQYVSANVSKSCLYMLSLCHVRGCDVGIAPSYICWKSIYETSYRDIH